MIAVFLVLAGLLGAVAVSVGAYAAHGMAPAFPEQAIAWAETGSRYQMVHAVAVFGTALALTLAGGRAARALLGASGVLFAIGAVLFPGALYGLAFLDVPAFGAVAPFGGGSLILGWVVLAVAGLLFRRS
ncbi:MAG: DUF423 domain-containing protein [Alphaproteobacteria bacterium]|jgi:uncharacterized membrane protein YgdD (TMEM256/DUF423 family)|nr:DUF423 domain-containing protein [Alphaproteobacteria bacterium]